MGHFKGRGRREVFAFDVDLGVAVVSRVFTETAKDYAVQGKDVFFVEGVVDECFYVGDGFGVVFGFYVFAEAFAAYGYAFADDELGFLVC